ncbi:MAG: glycosyltransferase [Deltaproteobacteria bacterium]|nr:glycosyltransferase [Deltaproteobacteria bacterium]
MRTGDFPSAHLLARLIRARFKSCWVLDPVFEKCVPPATDNVDVILMGNFSHELLHLDFWPRKNYRIWVLCEAARQVLIRTLGLKPEWVSVLCRYELFPAPPPHALPTASEDLTFIYSGRISRAKNVLLVAEVVSQLQASYAWPARLKMLGDFDGYAIEDAAVPEISSREYRTTFKQALKKLPWNEKPEIQEGLGSHQWLRHLPDRSVGISLSLHMKEDFGVSLAQLQQKCIPLIVSHWGANLDLNFANHIPLDLIAHPAASSKERRQSAKQISAFLHQNWKRWHEVIDYRTTARKPWSGRDYIARDVISARMQQKLMPLYPKILEVGAQNEWHRYCATKKGRAFLASYRAVFAGAGKTRPAR